MGVEFGGVCLGGPVNVASTTGTSLPVSPSSVVASAGSCPKGFSPGGVAPKVLAVEPSSAAPQSFLDWLKALEKEELIGLASSLTAFKGAERDWLAQHKPADAKPDKDSDNDVACVPDVLINSCSLCGLQLSLAISTVVGIVMGCQDC